MSRSHAFIERAGGGYRITDNGSAHGVYVDDQLVSDAVLGPGTRIRIGSTVFEFVPPPPPPAEEELTLCHGRPGFVVRISASGIAAETGKEFVVAGGLATIGRSEDCTVALGDPSASRYHARVEALGREKFRLVDTDSANGVWIDDRRVSEHVLAAGEGFEIGDTRLECVAAREGLAHDETVIRADLGRHLAKIAARRLSEAGEPVEVSGSKAFLIDDSSWAYYVVSGKVEIFAVTVLNHRPLGARSHFLTVPQGDGFFGMDLRTAGDSSFLATGKGGTIVRRIPRAELSRLAWDPALTTEIVRLIDTWVLALSSRLIRDVTDRPESECRISSGEALSWPAGSRVSAAEGVVWVPQGPRDVIYVGMVTLGPVPAGSAPAFPLTPSTWLEAAGTSDTVAVEGTATNVLVGDQRVWGGLDGFHDAFCECEFINKRLALVTEFSRLEDKAHHAEAAQEAALDAIGSVLADGRAHVGVRAPMSAVRPLLQACRLIGDRAGIEIAPSGDKTVHPTLDEQVQAIAAASRCRTRQVALRGDWWLSDHGPLLAFVAESYTPVALLPVGTRSYEIVDPAAGTRQIVSEAVAATLAPFAYSFYAPLPSGHLGAWDLVKFGARGLGSEFRSIAAIGVLTGAVGVAVPYLAGRMIDDAIPTANRVLLLELGLGMALIALANAAFKITQGFAVVRVETRMDYSLQAALWDRLLNLPAGFFRNYGAGDLAERAGGISAIRRVLWQAGVTGILSAVSSLAYLVLMLTYSARLTVVAVGLSLVVVAITIIGNLVRLRYQRTETTQHGRVSSLVLQLVSGVAKVRVAAAENHAFRVWAQQFSTQKRAGFATGQLQNVVLTVLGGYQVLFSLAIFAALWSLQSSPGVAGPVALTTGGFIAFYVAVGAFSSGLQGLSDASLSVLLVVPLFERIKPILETPPESDRKKTMPGRLRGEIALSHVSFRYAPDAPWVIKDLSLTIEPGQFVALVGASGCGKSTILRLMLGFEQAESGTILFDRQNLSSLDIRAVRQQFGVVLQESQVLPTDIFRNIVGTSARTMDDAWEAAEMAGLADDIRRMPMGMNTFVSEGGGTFSGGQRQRLLIARALVNKPRIIFFDEATSALDNQAQAVVTQSMDRLEVTRVVIAHRLSTIMNADRILYFEDGQLTEEGTYEQLMATNGAFARLARRQIA